MIFADNAKFFTRAFGRQRRKVDFLSTLQRSWALVVERVEVPNGVAVHGRYLGGVGLTMFKWRWFFG
jgi:hypothetical protein